MEKELTKREELYQDVLSYEPQHQISLEPTFLEIASMPHYENVASNIIGFFLDATQAHRLNDLFLSSLLELVDEKYGDGVKELDFRSWTVEREVGTKKGNRIDLEILNESQDAVLIIENKIFHWVANDLGDYWDHYPEIKAKNKGAIVLGLSQQPIPDERYIYVTHEELNGRILQNLGPYVLSANPHYLVLLKDYITNMKRFYMSNEDQMDFSFYFKHNERINELCDIKSRLAGIVFKQLSLACEILNDRPSLECSLGGTRTNRYRYFTFKETNDIYYTILVEDVLNGGSSYSILLETYHIDDAGLDVLRKVAKRIGSTGVSIADHKKKHNYYHLVSKSYPCPQDNLNDLSTEVAQHILNDFEDIRKALFQIYRTSKD